MAVEKRIARYLVDTGRRLEDGKPVVINLSPEQFDRAMTESLTRSANNPSRLPDPTTALRVVALYARGT